MKRSHFLILGGLLLLIIGLSLADPTPGSAQGSTPSATAPATGTATVGATRPATAAATRLATAAAGATRPATAAATATKAPTPQPIKNPLGSEPAFLVRFYQAWVKSGHADITSEPFKHWDAEGAVPTDCATCHSTVGYRDFLGEDGSTVGKVDKVAPVGGVINCDACHSQAAADLKTVAFPSGAKVGDMGDATRCMVCHQGRSSTVQVNNSIKNLKLDTEPNKPTKDLRFINIHYYAAAASIYGTEAQGGYQYDGKVYQGRYYHVDGYNTCIGCHNPHSLQVKVNECSNCHKDVKAVEDLRKVRMNGSLSDYDGDGNTKEGVAGEIEGLQDILLKAIQEYAKKVIGPAIIYDAATYPYFIEDKNANGKLDQGEAGYPQFTAKLLRAAYNLQVSKKDPGSFAHNAAYHIELLYDSIEDLSKELGTGGIDVTKLTRNDPGHFDSTGEPFRHWDADGVVPGTCAKCHTASGLPTFLANGANIGVKPGGALTCTTCHDKIPDFTVRASEPVTFPSGAKLTLGRKEADNLCLNCHQGRESTVSVNNVIKASGATADQVSDKLTFRNVHYFAAGASIFGGEAQGAYQYDGKQYSGRNMHEAPFQTCSDCHDTHALKIRFDQCTRCHEGAKNQREIRAKEDTVDYNGNGNKTEPVLAEITTLQEDLLKRIYDYATKTAGAAIVYTAGANPYWFIDTNKDGKPDPDELKSENRYVKWTPNLLRAAYNYQYVTKDPGAFAHNPGYILQVLYDSIESLGGKDAVAKYTRPEVKTSN